MELDSCKVLFYRTRGSGEGGLERIVLNLLHIFLIVRRINVQMCVLRMIGSSTNRDEPISVIRTMHFNAFNFMIYIAYNVHYLLYQYDGSSNGRISLLLRI